MVFTSFPVYLDPPNWNQQQTHQPTGGGGGSGVGELPQLQPPASAMTSAQRQDSGMTVAGTSIRPGSMADRARLAKIPQPEPALKCPRCDSTNTKFCYFNNYCLSQPRHFCKTCRRYWTRGGALRSVPVGGGFRRNKRSKSTSSGNSKSTSSAADRQAGASSSSSSTATSGSHVTPSNFPQHPQLPFFTSLHPLAEYGTPNLGLNFNGMQPIDTVGYQVGGSSSMGLEQWRIQQIQQFPFLGGLDTSSAATMVAAQVPGIYPFNGEGGADGFNGQVLPKVSSSGLITQLASVKMEDSNPQGFNFPRQYLGAPRNDHYWGGGGGGTGGWTGDLSGFNS